MAVDNWRIHLHMLEHAVSTLSAFDLETFGTNRDSFETVEFPLLLEDMKVALSALQSTCQRMEHVTEKESPHSARAALSDTLHHG